MTKEQLLDNLADMRRIHYSIWGDYSRDAIEHPGSGWLSQSRDEYEMKVRTLDYVMEAIRRHDII